MPLVSVITPCRNEAPFIEGYLRSVFAQRLPASWTLQVVVADGHSDDGTRATLDAFAAAEPRLLVVDNPAGQTAAGLNRALAVAHGEVIVRMDVHTRYAEDYVARCLAVLQDTGADMVGGPWRAQEVTGRRGAIARAFGSRFGAGGAASRRVDYSGAVDTVYLGAWRRERLLRLHGFDETLLRTEDDDLAFRIVREGGVVWQDASIRSWYRPRDSLAGLAAQMYQYGYWKVPLIRKHGRPASLRHLLPGAMVATLAALAVLGWWRPGFWLAAATVLAVYAAAALAAAAAVARPWREPASWLTAGAAFACMHFAYGAGFVRAVLDLLMRDRAPGARATRLTR